MPQNGLLFDNSLEKGDLKQGTFIEAVLENCNYKYFTENCEQLLFNSASAELEAPLETVNEPVNL